METLGIWIIPFTFLSGVGLLVLSTSNRYANVKNEIQSFTSEECEHKKKKVMRELRRAKLFRNALVFQYLSIGTFSLSSLISSLTIRWQELSEVILNVSTTVGVCFVVISAFQLIAESFISLKIMELHAKKGDD